MDLKELRDITIAYFSLLIMFSRLNPANMILLSVPLFTAFVLHEYGHIEMGKKLGYPARFVLWPKGIITSFIVWALTLGNFVIALPGAATIYAGTYARIEDEGKIALAGPLVNSVIGVVTLVLYFMGIQNPIIEYTSLLNAWIAIFNLIPMRPLDGSKIIRWKPELWGILLGINSFVFIFGASTFSL